MSEHTAEQRSYEELYATLEQILQRLDSGELTLEEALASYEQGMAVAAACQRLLDQAELRVRQVSGFNDDGSPQLDEWNG